MRFVHYPRRRRVALLLVVGVLVGFACADDPTGTPPRPFKPFTLEVAVLTTGATLDADGYRVVVDGENERIGVNDTIVVEVAAGTHDVELAGLALNCAVVGANPRSIEGPPDGNGSETFAVECAHVPIAFASDRGTDCYDEFWGSYSPCFSLYVLGTGGAKRILAGPDTVSYDQPAWSPDGSRVLFTRESGDMRRIFAMDADGANITQLTSVWAVDPAWSPDGTRMAFASGYRDAEHVYVMDAEGGDPTRLTDAGSVNAAPTWSPDGARIAFVTNRDGNLEIYVMNADGSDPVNVTRHPGADTDPAWSPDGALIAFSTGRDGGADIYVMRPDGSDPVSVTRSQGHDYDPAWSPDGTRIVFARDGFGDDIFVVGADGSRPTKLTSQRDRDRSPTWLPQAVLARAQPDPGQ